METAAKVVLVIAAGLAVLGVVLFGLAKLGVSRLPGDEVVRRGNLTLYAPVGLMILGSVVLTIVLNVLLRR